MGKAGGGAQHHRRIVLLADVESNLHEVVGFLAVTGFQQGHLGQRQGYFAGPKTPRNINRELEKKEDKEKAKKERSKKIGKGMKRKR